MNKENFNKWQEKFTNAAKRDSSFTTVSGLPINPLYTPADVANFDYEKDLGYPGEFPYTRGVQTTMYLGRLWTMRQFAGFATAKESNQRYKFLLSQGQTGLSVAFDMPTIMGYDSDHPRAYGEVGRVGVAIDSLQDMEILFDGIPLDKVSTSMTINAPASVIWSMYIATAEKQGVPSHKLTGTIQNDILKEYIAQKSWIFPPEPSMRLITDIFKFAKDHVPKWNTISISGYHIREAGSTAVQELAFTLADGFAYVEAGIAAGLDVDDFAPRLSFFFNAHLDFFEEIAKYRAARRIWARRMKEKYKAKDPRSWLLRFHTQTAGCSLTAQQPENNIIRTAYEALAAVLGGTQSLHTNSMDEVLALPTEKAVTIALRTQQIIAHEIGVTNTIDPLAGSYFVEALTNKMEEEAEKYFAKIEELGGVLKAIEKGFFQKEIADAAYEYQKAIDSKRRIVVGVNQYVDENEKLDIEILKIDPRIEQEQVARLQKLREERDNLRVQECLAELRKAANTSDNLIPYILNCVRCYSTLGEIIQVMRDEFGEYKEQPLF
ncbi:MULTISPECIES: methylmalonyl-CoA mutase [Carboxydocella]|uniref:Methylmalonyl-CoA mutase, N-terminal domain n=2 Tax=Carboxydocella TaxID=178898 RepID=A0A1T4LU11_9FIRM|nr:MULTISPECIES: methylmalonyl-CoA mutase family protein [Carboxydocella]AVX20614.1 methylmalonyl-CoA mutase [Carboxydocella thermautotrophica]AVX31036.1 methylmalonyl-CoA mutase [Carboxydocella thermautotrophica]SJZ58203.1 methylmalonyl-CoA mutase, N-terminal domain [Carboxydocella sporoproducens DSM 16521]GAW27937.1 methylmalonyl-CoA mutase [Carboxydocella sp. ULO1]GAW31542.1 methylmalonyl-CoA mutase [Carboxydocella sp. JDF658]